jgi:hypothetical protein
LNIDTPNKAYPPKSEQVDKNSKQRICKPNNTIEAPLTKIKENICSKKATIVNPDITRLTTMNIE